MDWYVRTSDGENGPLSEDLMVSGFHDGTYSEKTSVRAADGLMWRRLDESELGDTLGIKPATVTDDDGAIRRIQPELYRKISLRGAFLQIFLTLFAALCLIALIPIGYVFVETLIAPPFPDDLMNKPHLIGTLELNYYISLVRLIVFPFAAIFFILFFHQALKNVRVLGSKSATMPPWSIWAWFFVPFANVIQPVKAMSQLWSGAHHLAGRDAASAIPLFLWWTCWLLQAVALRIGDYAFAEMFRRANISITLYEPADFQTAYGAMFVGLLALLISTIGLMLIVTRISKLNKTLKHQFDVDAFS